MVCTCDCFSALSTFYVTDVSSTPLYGSVRLGVGSSVPAQSGVLLVYMQGQWGTVCDNEYGQDSGQVRDRIDKKHDHNFQEIVFFDSLKQIS